MKKMIIPAKTIIQAKSLGKEKPLDMAPSAILSPIII
jgi:hypothetical protein